MSPIDILLGCAFRLVLAVFVALTKNFYSQQVHEDPSDFERYASLKAEEQKDKEVGH